MHIGNQYPKDDALDPSGFLKRARLYQSKFRAEVLNLPCDTYGNYLTRKDGEDGKNFYNGLRIFETVRRRYSKYSKQLYSNMLRSEHIPFNLFVPLNENRDFCKNVFNTFFQNTISSIDLIKIEYAPSPKEKYLDDATSFDTYVEYTHVDRSKGIIGIEVKYTERGYSLTAKSTQARNVNDPNSRYYEVTKISGIYRPEIIPNLKTDKFRQIWRNQILGESILLADAEKFKHFTSVTIFPQDNRHFIEASSQYVDFLIDQNKFIALTYEDFFVACSQYCPDDDYKNWLEYLTCRYIVKD